MAAEWWVLNASPLITLSRVGLEHLLHELPERVCMPRAIAVEIEAGPKEDGARKALKSGPFPIIELPSNSPEILTWDLGSGETAVLSYTRAEAGWTAILDDDAARRCARSFAIPVKGTLAVILLAKQRGLIPSAAEVLRELRSLDFRLNDRIIREALAKTVGESW